VIDGVVTAPDGRTVGYADLADGDLLHEKVTGDAPLKSPDDYRVVGTAAPRPDIPRKVVAQGGFVSDVRVPGMLHARVVRPPAFGAHLVGVDASGLGSGVEIVRIGDFLAVVSGREDLAVRAVDEIVTTWTVGFETPSPTDMYEWMRRQQTDDALLADEGGRGARRRRRRR
jgi:CO/xanthine dehydrogenase Mo-binding subunit